MAWRERSPSESYGVMYCRTSKARAGSGVLGGGKYSEFILLFQLVTILLSCPVPVNVKCGPQGCQKLSAFRLVRAEKGRLPECILLGFCIVEEAIRMQRSSCGVEFLFGPERFQSGGTQDMIDQGKGSDFHFKNRSIL